MRKTSPAPLLFLSLFGIMVFSCEKDQSPAKPAGPPPVLSKSFVEEFDTVANLGKKGWVIKNNSFPFGPQAWRQGMYELGGKYGNDIAGFPAYSAVYNQNEFVSVDLNCGQDLATLSCWLITCPIPAKNGDELSFYTRTHGDYADRLQVRVNYANTVNVGNGPEEVGDFDSVLLDINPNLIVTDYPNQWTKYTIMFSGLPDSLKNLRIGFRYYVTNGGPSGSNSDMIGIDKMEFVSK